MRLSRVQQEGWIGEVKASPRESSMRILQHYMVEGEKTKEARQDKQKQRKWVKVISNGGYKGNPKTMGKRRGQW